MRAIPHKISVLAAAAAATVTFTAVALAVGHGGTATLAATSYSYQVRALDAAGNQGPFSNSGSATTKAAASGLVAAYSFDAGSGSTVTDSSGNGNTGTISGATWTSQGKYGSALSFNGTNARIDVPSSASLQLSSGMTLEAWVDPASVSSAWRDVIYKGNDNYYLMGTTDHAGIPSGGGTFAGANVNAFAAGTLATNSWSFLAATYDGATLRFYVNGTLAASQAASGAITSSINQLQIGGDSLYGQYFNGLIDQVRIYNQPLSVAAIQTDMNTPVSSGGSTDTQPPSTPTRLAVSSAGQTTLALSWTAASDNVGVTSYGVYNNGILAGSPVTTSYALTGLVCGTSYTVAVDAVDAAGNRSGKATITTSTNACPDTTPPTAPTGLAVSSAGQTTLALSWTAASDNVGVTSYGVYNNGILAGSPATTSYALTGLACGTSYTVAVDAVDAAGNRSGKAAITTSTNACPDTTPPTAPTGLAVSSAGQTTLALSWGAASDNVGVTGYQVFRCQGAGCTSFVQVGTASVTSFNDTGLAAATSYSYQVRALDAAGNQGPFSNSGSATTKAAASGLVAAYSFDAGSGSTVTDSSGNGNTGTISGATWTSQGKYGSALSFNGTNARIDVPSSASLQLSSGMTLEAWVDPASVSSAWRDVIYKGNDNYYLMGTTDHAGIPGGGGTFAGANVNAFAAGTLATNSWSFLAATYDGATLRFYVNGTLAASQAASGAITSSINQLQIGGDSLYGQYFNGLIDQVRIYNQPLSVAAIQTDMNTPVSSGGSTDTQPPSTPTGLAASGVTQTAITLSWNPSSDNVGVTGYRLYQNGTQVRTSLTTSYLFSGLGCGTGYTLGVAAVDAANNVSGIATLAQPTAACSDTQPPLAPKTLSASAATSSEIDLSWGAASDNVGVTGYQVFRCQGAGCTSFVQVGTASVTSFNDTGLAAATSYSYQVRALDAAGNQGPFSNSGSATTKAAASGLVAAYSFDAGSGSTVTDSSGNGNTGTISGATWTSQGKYGSALSFNGTNARIDVPSSASLQLSSGMTLEAWVDPASVSSAWRDVIYKGNDNYYLMGTTDHAGIPSGGGTFAGANVNAFAAGTLATNSWSFLAATYDGATLRFYVNGTLAASQAASGAITSSINQLQIGGDSLYGQYFNGLIDQVRIYNQPLSVAAIQTDMNTPVSSGGSTDTQPPSTPTGLAASGVTQTAITLSWNPSSDNVGVTGYRLFRNGAEVGAPSATTYSDSPLTASTTYSYTVEAVDAAGNVSVPSATLGVTTAPAPTGLAYPLKASASGRYLVDQNNVPFLMVGDSPQAMINLSEADMATYMADRQAHGFNTIWVNLLCEDYTFCNSNGTTYDGIKPFNTGTSPSNYDLSTPNPTYFARVDDMLNLAKQYGLVVMLDPIPTDGLGSPSWWDTLNNNGATKDLNYGAYLGSRYKNFTNIIWMSGNDFQYWQDHLTGLGFVADVMQGIAQTDPNHVQTIEMDYPVSTSLDAGATAIGPYLKMNAAYTYYPTYAEVLQGYNQSPTMPVFMVEANYEGENNTGNDPSTPQVLRQQEYWTMTSGATGQLYGSHYTAGFLSGWQTNLDTVGVTQLHYETSLLSRLPWWTFVPDQNHTVLTAGYGTYSATGPLHTNDYATAARASDGSTIVIYMPSSRTITVDMSKITGSGVTARWFDPTNGTFTTVSGSPFANSGSHQFTPPGNNAEGSSDWLLVLQGP